MKKSRIIIIALVIVYAIFMGVFIYIYAGQGCRPSGEQDELALLESEIAEVEGDESGSDEDAVAGSESDEDAAAESKSDEDAAAGPGSDEVAATEPGDAERGSAQSDLKLPLPDSGITVCIDPGHYKGASDTINDGAYSYEEGQFTIKVALLLQEELKQYGIDSYLTRESDSITISGYSNGDLDHGKISLRGEYSQGADLFVSIHTNANLDNANGYPTTNQPVAINKTIVIVNEAAKKSDEAMNVANAIGQELTKTNYRLNLSYTDKFDTVSASNMIEWTDKYNDSLNTPGTVCYRSGSKGDYYGVLRGATNVGTPGMIVEHSFHTVKDIRNQAINGDLAEEWAKAEAYGIAKGFGLIE